MAEAAPAVASAAPAGDSTPRAVVPTPSVEPTAPATPVASGTLPETTMPRGDQAPVGQDDPFANSAAALAALQSYRYVTVLSFTGEVDGKPESGSMEVSGAVAGPDRQMVTWKDLDTGEEYGVVRIADEAWMREGETWESVPTMVADLMAEVALLFAPSASWGEMSDDVGTTATYVGTETVNGIRARHYTSTYRDWAEEGEGEVEVEDASGDVWIAEAGYPVRYRFTAKGIDAEGNEGSMLWTMELSDVNGLVTIEAPQVVENAGE